MKVLFIGGTGVISSACAEFALARGIELYLLNRGESARPAPVGAQVLHADIRDRAQTKAALAGRTFDAVVDWVAFTPEHIAADIELFRGRTAQYVFISSATVYEKPPSRLPITESTPRRNPFWPYAANKIACEERLEQAYRSEQFPVTIVRLRTPTTAPSCLRSATTPRSRACAWASRPWSTATGPPSGC